MTIMAVLSVCLLLLSACLLILSLNLFLRAPAAQSPAHLTQGGDLPADEPASAGTASTPPCRVGVWLQAPENAAGWKELGVECFVGQWNPVTDQTLETFAAADVPFMTEVQDPFAPGAIPEKAEGLVLGWLTPHEPDLSQGGNGAPATPPETVIAQAEAIKAKDPDRPVMVYLSTGVAIPTWFGMGADAGRWEAYYKQIVSSPAIDLIAFNYYPWNTDSAWSGGGPKEPDPQYVVDGVSRLTEWSGGKPVYPTLAASQVSEKFSVPTVEQTTQLADQLLDAGADGIIWFGHDFNADGQYVRDAHPLQVEDGAADMVRQVSEQVKQRLAG